MVLSALGGLDGVDFEADLDTDVDFVGDADFDDIDFGTHGGRPKASRSFYMVPKRRFWLPIFSFRFWTFAVCFFGLTGLLLTLFQSSLFGWQIALISVLMGLICGTAAALILRKLGSNQVNSLSSSEELVGQIGTVEIPFNSESRGKVRLGIKGSTVSFSAFSQESREFQQGDTVLVVGLENNRLWVVSTDVLQAGSLRED